jgi:hypothetical protein
MWLYSYGTTTEQCCQLVGISQTELKEIASVYDSVWFEDKRVAVARVAYLAEWYRRHAAPGESITVALRRLLASMPRGEPDCVECLEYATVVNAKARKMLGIVFEEDTVSDLSGT